ncbi:MAG: hypothetical protein WEC37_02780 [Anaerolineales bacterium]
MNSKAISDIKQRIYRQFPEVAGEQPSVKSQASAKSPGQTPRYLLTFKGSAQDAGGPSFSRTVRVVADDNGRILKVTTSR